MRNLTRRLSPLVLAILPLALAAGSGTAVGQQSDAEQEHFRAIRLLYGSAAWPEGTLRDGIPLASLVLEGWSGGELQCTDGNLSRSFSRAGIEASATSFVVEARVSDTPKEAQETLLTWLAGLSTDRKMPAVREWSLSAGDVGFLGPAGAGPRAIAWIAFVRGNVAVRVLAFDPRSDPELDLGSVAAGVDAAILSRQPLLAGSLPPRPKITRLVPAKPAVVAGETVLLDTSVIDSAGGEAHLQWIVGGPGQGFVEKSATGAYELHTTGPGRIVLTLEVTGSTGTGARQSVELTVEDD